MRIALFAVAFAALAGGALANEPPNAQAQAKDAAVAAQRSAKVLYVCEDNAMTRRAFAREFGAAEFVTAEAVRADGKAWAAPKCITSAEARRLKAEKRLASAR